MRKLILGITIGVVLASTAVAVASIPSADGTIHGCRSTKTGALRSIDADAGQTCTKDEAGLNWNQTGPAGPQGPPGQGTQVEATRVTFFESVITGETQTRSLRCPSGSVAAGTPAFINYNLESAPTVDPNFHYTLVPYDTDSNTTIDGYDVLFVASGNSRIYATLTCLTGVAPASTTTTTLS
jgi:hypothetical protein